MILIFTYYLRKYYYDKIYLTVLRFKFKHTGVSACAAKRGSATGAYGSSAHMCTHTGPET